MIVDELKAAADWLEHGPPPTEPPPRRPVNRMLRDAAAEIERRRAAARLVVETWDAEDHPVSMPNLRRAIDGLRDTSEQDAQR